jgi:CheY-like chemotaxis protein
MNEIQPECACRLLLVDDESVALEIYKGIFSENYELAVACNGNDGLALARSFNPDVVVLDAVMPGERNGWDVCREIKSDPSLRGIKIIMVSSKAISTDCRMDGYLAGADDYIVKPFIHEDIITKVQIWAQARRKEEDLENRIAQLEKARSELEIRLHKMRGALEKYSSNRLPTSEGPNLQAEKAVRFNNRCIIEEIQALLATISCNLRASKLFESVNLTENPIIQNVVTSLYRISKLVTQLTV